MANIVDQYANTIVTIFQNVTKTYEKNAVRIKEIEDELNDINHEIEFATPRDMYKGWQLYSQIRELRNERRQLKEQNEMLKDMYEFLTTQPAQGFQSKIRSIQGASIKVENAQRNRTYKARQRTDLTIENKTHDNKSFEQLMKEFKETKVSIKGGKLRK